MHVLEWFGGLIFFFCFVFLAVQWGTHGVSNRYEPKENIEVFTCNDVAAPPMALNCLTSMCDETYDIKHIGCLGICTIWDGLVSVFWNVLLGVIPMRYAGLQLGVWMSPK